ncbi:MAG: type II toxin-antitoxin system RelE/ParE family toxin [Bryobacteraceae bacterium]
MKRYTVSLEARSDLDGIWDYIAERSSAETAAEFLWKFYASFPSIASSPSAGVAMPDFQPAGIRRFLMGKFLIYYLPGRGKISILRVFHGKRLQMKTFKERPKAKRAGRKPRHT